MKNRLTYQNGNNILVFRLGTTTNKKIAEAKEKILQTYSFSLSQFNYVKLCMDKGTKIEPKQFFSLADSNCLDCPFTGYLKCYTHKYMQFSGFVSMLKSIIKEFGFMFNIPDINDQGNYIDILQLSSNRFVRFGSYGEPTLIPQHLVFLIASRAKSYTGYTHQWMNRPEFAPWFMASVHSVEQAKIAEDKGWRSFIASKKQYTKKTAVVCPASAEAGYT